MSEVTVGRPTVITQATVQKLEDAFKAGFTVSEACSVSGISRAAYYDHKANDEGFSDKMDRARAWVTLQAKHVMVKAITVDGDVTSSKWWLERKARNEFGTNAIDEDAQWEAQHTTNQSDDVLRQILDSMGDIAKTAISENTEELQQASTPQHAQLKAISVGLTAFTPDTSIPIEPATVQVGTSTDDVLADLYGED